ncbi:hypothetical protein Pcinc_031326 [Petrolisthes cinctipes]|uniref:Uncharacterized protein n=1 Tax=Petrolisthes cinctipes TaxID=88211 RepID=A0AAE1EWK1_PETCI|nr:hypothetical protein Pcinc_031326 [Petrolisthes cinctipes]
MREMKHKLREDSREVYRTVTRPSPGLRQVDTTRAHLHTDTHILNRVLCPFKSLFTQRRSSSVEGGRRQGGVGQGCCDQGDKGRAERVWLG